MRAAHTDRQRPICAKGANTAFCEYTSDAFPV